jgi:hypothetical protein
MKLIFAHIVEHKILKNISIPFCSELKCTFDGETLAIGENPDYLAGYYNGVNISAIIGTNGSGKTSVLDFIESSNGYTESIGLIVWYNEVDDLFGIQTLNLEQPLNLDFSGVYDFSDYQIGANLSDFYDYEYDDYYAKEKLFKFDFSIFKVNNINEFTFNAKPRTNNKYLFDHTMSTINRSNKKKTHFMQQLFDFISSDVWVGNKGVRTSYRFTLKEISRTIYRQIENDIVSDEFREFYEKLFDTVSLKFNNSFGQNASQAFEHIKQRISHISKCDFNNLSMNEEIYTSIVMANIFTLINKICKEHVSSPTLMKIIRIEILLYVTTATPFISSDIVSVIHSVLKRLESTDSSLLSAVYRENSVHEIPIEAQLKRVAEEVQQALESFQDLAYFLLDSKAQITGSSNSFTVNDASFLTKLHQKIANMEHFLNGSIVYGWEGFSSGELARIGLFSQIFHHLSKDDCLFTLVVIDEADLYMHPEWQRTFVSELINMMNKIKMEGQVQIILTSHSPLIIGDFLPEDIVTLKLIDGIPTAVESFGFGTEITDAFLYGMHLNSTYGEHARSKLQRLINTRKRGDHFHPADIKLINKIKDKSFKNALLSRNASDMGN